jgi:hypothetical protein
VSAKIIFQRDDEEAMEFVADRYNLEINHGREELPCEAVGHSPCGIIHRRPTGERTLTISADLRIDAT